MNKSILIAALLISLASSAVAQTYSVEIESGWLWVGRADVLIPGDEGTRFSFKNDLDADSTAYMRGRFEWRPVPRHGIIVTLAPLEATASGTLAEETRFADTTFPAASTVDATYRFNNYRLTYRYRLYDAECLTVDLGGTLFVRDAKITLDSGELRDSDDDLGVVPLVSFGATWRPLARWAFVADGDALAAPQGRALDARVSAEYAWSDQWRTGLGYRILEGGADNDDVYTFALFHHAAVYVRAAW